MRRRSRATVTDGKSLDATLPFFPPLSKGGQVVDGSPPRKPKIRDDVNVIIILKNGGDELPKTRTRRNGIRNRNRQKNSRIVRERTWKDVIRRNS